MLISFAPNKHGISDEHGPRDPFAPNQMAYNPDPEGPMESINGYREG